MKILNLLMESHFNPISTDMPYYDIMLHNTDDQFTDEELKDYFKYQKGIVWEVVEMSPIDYVEHVAKAKNTTYAQLYTNRDSDKIAKYAQMMQNGTVFPMTVLDYASGRLRQEGLHRSFAAEQAGIRTMPVLVVNDSGY
jgi:hypothetical protein